MAFSRIFAIAVMVVLGGCGSNGQEAAPGPGDVVVTVAGQEITAGEFARYEADLPEFLRSQKTGMAARREHLQSLVDKELMLLEVEQRGLDQLSGLQWKLGDLVTKRLVEEMSLELVDNRLRVTEEEMRKAYEEHELGWEVWPAHILSASEEDAREVIRLLGEGRSFSELARERSLADDADKGGNLGAFFDQGSAVPQLKKGTFHLAEGEVSEPIRTIDGYEIVKVLKKRRLTFEALRGKIAEGLLHKKWAQRRRTVVDSLKEKRDVRYHRHRIHAVLDGIHRRGIAAGAADEPLIEYTGGTLSVADAVREISGLKKGAMPPDSVKALLFVEMWILPDSLFILDARELGWDKRPTILDWREAKRRALAIAQLRLDEVGGKVEVSDEEVEAYYEKYYDTYKRLPGIIHMTELLVATRAEADRLLARARAGEQLEGLAARYSLRPDMEPVGGHAFADSGRVTIESLYQSPYRDVFGDSNVEDVGVLQGPLEVQDHYSVFRLDQPFEKAAVSFKQVRRPIRVDIRERKEGALFAAFLDSLRRARVDQVHIDEGVLARHAAAP